MTAEDELRDEVGKLISGTGPRPIHGVGMGIRGPETPEQKIAPWSEISRLSPGASSLPVRR
jgi:hypothetical protein